MNRKLLTLLLTLFLCFSLTISAQASEALLFDEADPMRGHSPTVGS